MGWRVLHSKGRMGDACLLLRAGEQGPPAWEPMQPKCAKGVAACLNNALGEECWGSEGKSQSSAIAPTQPPASARTVCEEEWEEKRKPT